MKIYQQLRRYLEDNEISQSYVAQLLGWSRQRLWAVLHGRAQLRAQDLVTICNELGVDVETILNYAVPT